MIFSGYKKASAPQSSNLQGYEIDSEAQAIKEAMRRKEITQLMGAGADGYGMYSKATGNDPIADALRKMFGDDRTLGTDQAEEMMADQAPTEDLYTPSTGAGEMPPLGVSGNDAAPLSFAQQEQGMQGSMDAAQAQSQLAEGEAGMAFDLNEAGMQADMNYANQEQGMADMFNTEGAEATAPNTDMGEVEGLSDALRSGEEGAGVLTEGAELADKVSASTGAGGMSGGDMMGYANMANSAAQGDAEGVAKAAMQKYLASLGPWGMAAGLAMNFV